MRLISLFYLRPPCNKICMPTNHPLNRWHISCLACSTRKAQYNSKYVYDKFFGCCLPRNFDAITAILNDGSGYIIFNDETAFMHKQKRILQSAIFAIAERSYNTRLAKKLYTVCELLAT